MDERRLLVAFSLSLLVLIGFQALYPPPKHKPAEVPAARTAASPSASRPAAAVETTASANAGKPGAAVATVPPRADERERRIDVETRDAIVGFTNRGARVVSWRLTQFRDANGHPEEMVQTTSGTSPLDIETGDPAVDEKIRTVLFSASAEQLSVAAGEEKVLTFDYAGGDLEVQKAATFSGTGYLVGVTATVKKGGAALPVKAIWGPGIGNPTAGERGVRGYEEPAGAVLIGDRIEMVPAGKLKEPLPYPDLHWIGVSGRYFAAVWVAPGGHGLGELRQGPVPALPGGDPRVGATALFVLPSAAKTLLFVGPKEYRQLVALDHDLARIVPVGDWWFFRQIVIGFMDLLHWLYTKTHNYGWSVILLTVLINLVMAPLRHYGVANSVKMAKISPEMKVIQERYRKYSALDPKKQDMQKEMAALYERHGMNMGTQMLVGCFPMLLTMPFLFAIWKVLNVSIELRGAHFLWIPDLSQPDPMYVMPILMAASMFISQRTMPTTMDPAQQRMMMIMPIVFVAFFFSAPGGLNLYWFASNACTIVQQTITLRILKTREASAKERRKK